MSEEIMLTEQQQAEALHKQIKSYGSIIMQSFYGLCVALKEMRDSKLYRALGYSEFDYYCKAELGTSDRQVYKYIAIAENLSEEFVNSNSLIGVSKLYLLTTTDEETRAEIVESTDLTDTTVKELREQITQLAADRDALAADRQREGLRADRLARESKQKDAQIADLSAQVQELESRPIEVAVPDASHEVENMRDAMRRLNREHDEWSARIQDEHFKDVQRIHKGYREKMDQLRAEYEEKLADSQQGDAPEPGGKEIFKAYLANAIDAAKRLTGFLAAHPDDTCRAQAVRFFEAAMKEVQA